MQQKRNHQTTLWKPPKARVHKLKINRISKNQRHKKINEKDGGVKEKETLKTNKVKVVKGKQSEKVDGVKNEKAPKTRKRDANEDVHEVVNLDDAEDLDDYGKLQVRVGHFKFMTFASNLSPSQKQAIIDMGFGALLDVNLPQNDQSFSAWLMHCFEENSRTLYLPYNKSIVVCEEDVEVVYGIPRGEKEVKEVEDEEQEETPLTRWGKYWGVVSGSPKTHNVLKKYESGEEKEKKMEIIKEKMNKKKLEQNLQN
uniref:Uncharacterized protein n=1 Tax=Chenopodium quinoa TaxID=63459 RepID=A0A803MDK4_CHEQI